MLTTINIGNKIAEGRKMKNLSQVQLGQLLSISSQAVGKWERGESMPDIITLDRIAEIYGVDLNYFSYLSSSPPDMACKNKSDEPCQSNGIDEADHSSESDEADHSSVIGGTTHNINPESHTVGASPESRRAWNMSNGNWIDADFSGLKNLHEKFSGSNIQKCLFVDSDLAGLLLKGNNVVHCDFTRSDLKGSRIDSSNVQNCIFTNADLSHIDFSKSQIKGCDFTAADLSDATIKYSSFVTNNVADAIWNRTASIGSNFTGMTFSGSLNDCSFENCEFSRVTFENATLTNCFFKGNNLKRVRFIDCKSDKLTLAFLKSGKADTTGITVVDSEGR